MADASPAVIMPTTEEGEEGSGTDGQKTSRSGVGIGSRSSVV
jgi:hypothetical protein